MDITIQTVAMVMGIVFWLVVFALLFSWLNAKVKAYYSPKPYYSRRPKSQISSIWDGKRAIDDGYGIAQAPTFDDSSYHIGLGLRLDSDAQDKRIAGHVTEAMRQRYDRKVPVRKPAK